MNVTTTLGENDTVMVPEPDAVRTEMKEGFLVIQGGPPLKQGDIVRALKADRDAREERILSTDRPQPE